MITQLDDENEEQKKKQRENKKRRLKIERHIFTLIFYISLLKELWVMVELFSANIKLLTE